MLKILSSSFATLCLVGAAALMADSAFADAPDGKPSPFVEDASPADFYKTLSAFRDETKAAGWSVVTEHNLAGNLSARGYTLHPVMVLEICNVKFAAQLLARDETRSVSSMMPCRVSIYETSTGKVMISRMNAPLVASMLDGEAAEVALKANSEMENIIKKTLAKVK